MGTDLRGLYAIIAASALWGVAPIYFHALASVPAGQILAHRILWTMLSFMLVLGLSGRWPDIRELVIGPKRGRVLAASALIAVNWGVFIWAVNSGHALESSLGYFIYPLVTVALGVVLRGERPDRAQYLAIALAAVGVLVLTLGLGLPPWIALILAFSFSCYALIKSRINVPGAISVTAEALVLSPFALIWLVYTHASGQGAFGQDAGVSVLLALAGLVTGIPLILFSIGSQRIPLSLMGMVQYLNPTLQALVAVTIFGEGLTPWHVAAFALIWLGLAVYSTALFRSERAALRARSRAGTSGTGATNPIRDSSAKPSATI